MELTRENIYNALSYVIEPDLKKDVIALNLVTELSISGNKISFILNVRNPAMHNRKRMEEACLHNLKRFLGEDIQVKIHVAAMPKTQEILKEQRTVLPEVKNIVAIASGKGGVGKSTITANLAVGLVQKGFKVGIIDADIYGPSIPIMFDVTQEKPGVQKGDDSNKMTPVEGHGVKILSIGFFADSNQAVAWRGPMASKALNQMINDVAWGELDYMLIDLPPGTGDIHLSLVQALPLTGAVVVSTPQIVALADARKGVAMFRMDGIKVPVLGIVENMSYFSPAELPDNKYFIFGEEGAKHLAEELKIPCLGQIPLVQSIREAGDVGRPSIMQETTPQAIAFKELTDNFLKSIKQEEPAEV
ncbi:MAG: Mrp/NBP35 family ATP-binding protein [Flavobacteriales bacterium]|nr:Mrp/NBP35 family ATP-binding protein [Flavobacteriales bacterium]